MCVVHALIELVVKWREQMLNQEKHKYANNGKGSCDKN